VRQYSCQVRGPRVSSCVECAPIAASNTRCSVIKKRDMPQLQGICQRNEHAEVGGPRLCCCQRRSSLSPCGAGAGAAGRARVEPRVQQRGVQRRALLQAARARRCGHHEEMLRVWGCLILCLGASIDGVDKEGMRCSLAARRHRPNVNACAV
jgi:hypothetical protein